jgi:uncharacterized membrane protein YhaH (DUF805 family)
VFSNYAKFDGRSSRAEYWWFVLASAIVQLALFILSRASAIMIVLYFGYAVATAIPGIAAGIRRLHDAGRSGWWLFISLVPCVGTIVLIVFLATEGDVGPNQFGSPPRQPIVT